MSGDDQRTKGDVATPVTDTASLGLPPLSAQPGGSLTSDFATDTDDIATLKQRLGRARERLSFYESFDRIIQENIRRSSELMIEATELHARAQRARDEQARAHAALLGDLQTELDRTRQTLEGLAGRLTSALGELAGDSTPATADPAAGDETTLATVPAATIPTAPDASGSPTTTPPLSESPRTKGVQPGTAAAQAVAAAPRLVEVLVHGVPTARVAISLQNHLRGLDQVSTVEAREFVEGLLRLQVTGTAPLDAAALAGWSDGAGADTLRVLPDLLEISLPGTTER